MINRKLWIVSASLIVVSMGIFFILKKQPSEMTKKSVKPNPQDVLEAIVKNDQNTFESFLRQGGQWDSIIESEGRNFKVFDLLVEYQRIHYLSSPLINKNNLNERSDIWFELVEKNKPELLTSLQAVLGKSDLTAKRLEDSSRGLLHHASATCASKLIPLLEEAGLSWSDKDSSGSTPLTLAAQGGCLDALVYWKEKGANFNAKNGQGKSAISILSASKDSALAAFVRSFGPKLSAGQLAAPPVASGKTSKVPNFYKKRVYPGQDADEQSVDLSNSQDRPDEAYETSSKTEFSD